MNRSLFACMLLLVALTQLFSAPFLPSQNFYIVVSGQVPSGLLKYYDEEAGVIQLSWHYNVVTLGTHKPVFVLAYSSWAKNLEEIMKEYTQFAHEIHGNALPCVIDADANPKFSNDHGIVNVPTVLFWNTGEKAKVPPEVYRGNLTAKGLLAFLRYRASRGLSRVEKLNTPSEIREVLQDAPFSTAAVFFSSQSQPPIISHVMSMSNKLVPLRFIFVSNATSKKVAKVFGITSIPTAAAVRIDEVTKDLVVKTFPKAELEYRDLAQFFLEALKDGKKNSTKPDRCWNMYNSSVNDL